MNYFTQKSIELANHRDYLDRLFHVYPLTPDSIRSIDYKIWHEIEKAYNSFDNVALFKALLKLDLFPVKDSYVPFFRRNISAIQLNPQTVNRICGRVREMGIDKLYEKISEPKETNRQIGPLFRRWVESGALGISPIGFDDFISNNDDAILYGSDKSLKDFAADYLGFKRDDDKGLDFIGRFNNTYVIGEAKFISDEGGHQDVQFLDAMTTLGTPTRSNVKTVAILDGVLYRKSRTKKYKTITTQDVNVMSALVLGEYLHSL